MSKIECNSREGILDFIESSENFSFIKQHYINFRIREVFEKKLKELARLKGHNNVSCLIIDWSYGRADHISLISFLKDALKRIGISISVEAREDSFSTSHLIFRSSTEDHVLCILPFMDDHILETITPLCADGSNLFFLLPDNGGSIENLDISLRSNFINLAAQNVYLAFFKVVENIFPILNVDPIKRNFQQQYKAMQVHVAFNQGSELTRNSSNERKSITIDVRESFKQKKWRYLLIVFGLACLVWFGYGCRYYNQTVRMTPNIKANLKKGSKNLGSVLT